LFTLTGHIQPSVHNPDTDGAAKLLNTTSHYFKKTAIIKQYNQQYILLFTSNQIFRHIYKDTLPSFTIMPSVIPDSKTIRKQL